MNIVDCGHDADLQKSEHTTGYGLTRTGHKHCFDCCGKEDLRTMTRDGKIILYLTMKPEAFRHGDKFADCTVSNWPGTLKFQGRVRKGRHNIARNRYDVWFNGPDGKQWHGVQYGDNTQICHVKRNKKRA